MAADTISRNVLAERAVGQFPISIATSLAIESAIGILPEAPTDSPEIKKRQLLMINIRTLIRNLYGSVPTEQRAKLEEYTIAETISNEMRAIEGITAEHSDGRCSCVFYHCSYVDIPRKFPKSLPKSPSTAAQQLYQTSEQVIIRYLDTEFASGSPLNHYVSDFPDMNVHAMLVTHYPIDLLQRYRFASLVLLESHTGAVKSPVFWNTKLHNGRELENLPFDRMTLQMFGDGVTFSPMPIKIRRTVHKLAMDGGWTPGTTKDLVIRQVEQHRDPALEMLVKELYRK